MERLPPGAEPVWIAVDPTTTLRGWFVPSDPGAPVVLHLLESGASALSLQGSFGLLTRELSGLGFASLAVDYTGIGKSGGTCSCVHLARDATAMWREAVMRAGGDPSRVVVRATSIGTLAAGSLIANGARPGGLILLLPVSAHTLVKNFASAFYSPAVGLLGTVLYRDVIQPDLADSLEAARSPILAVSSPDEQFVGPDERAALRSAVERTGGTWIDLPGGHLQLTLRSRQLTAEETEFLRGLHTPPVHERLATCLAHLPAEVAARFPEGSVERARLERQLSCVDALPALDAAAVALAFEDPLDGRRIHRRLDGIRPKMGGFDALLSICSLDDPGGRIPVALLDDLCGYRDETRIWGGFDFAIDPYWVQLIMRSEGHRFSIRTSATMSPLVGVSQKIDGDDIRRQLSEQGRPPEVVLRQFARLLLKTYGFPERVRTDSDGRVVLECMEDGAWVPLDLEKKEESATGKTAAR